jgi:hypothetical protein
MGKHERERGELDDAQASPRRSRWLGRLGLANLIVAAALIAIWWYLLSARESGALPVWVPIHEDVIAIPAILCAGLGLFTVVAGAIRWRAGVVLAGLVSICVGAVGLVFVTFMYVFEGQGGR